MQVQSHWVSVSVAQGEPFHRVAQHGCALPSGQKFPHTDSCDARRSVRNVLLCGEVAERTVSEACWAAEWTRLGAMELCDRVDMAVEPRRSAR